MSEDREEAAAGAVGGGAAASCIGGSEYTHEQVENGTQFQLGA